jgi:hypothetical protein
MSITVVAEKPPVGRDLARVLGATRKAEGCLEGNDYRVTWSIGHLVTLAEPAEIRREWKKWRRDLLPMLPTRWPLVVLEKTRAQYEVVRKPLTGADVAEVVCDRRRTGGGAHLPVHSRTATPWHERRVFAANRPSVWDAQETRSHASPRRPLFASVLHPAGDVLPRRERAVGAARPGPAGNRGRGIRLRGVPGHEHGRVPRPGLGYHVAGV